MLVPPSRDLAHKLSVRLNRIVQETTWLPGATISVIPMSPGVQAVLRLPCVNFKPASKGSIQESVVPTPVARNYGGTPQATHRLVRRILNTAPELKDIVVYDALGQHRRFAR